MGGIKWGNESAIFEVDGIPFLAAGYDNAAKLWVAQRPILEELLDEEGLMLLFSVPWPGQALYSQDAVKSLDDMKGVKFRAYNAATSRLAELMGALPTTVQYAEVPQMMARISSGSQSRRVTGSQRRSGRSG